MKNMSLSDRNASEREFFTQEPWDGLPKDRVGVEKLKPYLDNMLYLHIQKEIPAVLADIDREITGRERNLKSLGDPRDSEIENGEYLKTFLMAASDIVNEPFTLNKKNPFLMKTVVKNG